MLFFYVFCQMKLLKDYYFICLTWYLPRKPSPWIPLADWNPKIFRLEFLNFSLYRQKYKSVRQKQMVSYRVSHKRRPIAEILKKY